MKHYLVLLGLVILTSNAFGQQIENPSVKRSDIPNCNIRNILTTFEKTIVEFDFVAPYSSTKSVEICANDNFFIRDNETGKKFFLTKANHIPICPQKHHFSRQGESLQFSLEFQRIPEKCTEIDIIENLSGKGLNFYGVGLIKVDKANSADTKKNQAVTYDLTLTSEGKLKNKGDLFGEVIYSIPRGSIIEVYSKDNGYYKVNHNGTIGYLNEIYFKKNNYISKQANQSPKKISNQLKIKSLYKDGKIYQYYIRDGISVTVHLSVVDNNNKYYIAYVAIENLTGNPFNFDPNEIRAVLMKNETVIYGKVMSSSESLKSINNRLSMKATLSAFGESNDLNQEAYVSSSSKPTSAEISNSYGSTPLYYKNANASSRHPNKNKSYDEAVNDAVERNIRNSYQIKNVLNQGYLKPTTINHEERLVGQLNISYKSADIIQITIPVNGESYDFRWNVN
jgi:hypothetical protein